MTLVILIIIAVAIITVVKATKEPPLSIPAKIKITIRVLLAEVIEHINERQSTNDRVITVKMLKKIKNLFD